MSKRLDWTKARFVGKPYLDYRREFEFPDRAARWIAAAERNQAQRRQARPRERRSFSSSTQASSEAPPW
jgi:hypothetical protein